MTREEFQKKFGIIGRSKVVKDLVDIIMRVANSDISVLIYGESGVGKEIFANALHGFSARSNKRMVSVNCGAIPEGILESELFGHEKGSFTGAVESRKGYFEIADGGTLFLDEIGEMPITTQVKLLRVLETNEFMRLGSERVTKVDVRIIAASNKELQEEVDKGRFRKDLFFRLKAVSINIPPLRERKEDVALLLDHFLNNFKLRNNRNDLTITSDAYELLNNYYWPGNIRELKNVIETSAALSKENILTSLSFVNLLSLSNPNVENRNLPIFLNKGIEETDRELIYRALIEIKKDLMELKNIASTTVIEKESAKENIEVNEIIPIELLEKRAIVNALKYTKWNKKKAAALLNVSERTLYRKIKDYDIH